MSPEQKAKIDSMTYKEMLTLWRFASAAHELFLDDTGTYFSTEMAKKAQYLTDEMRVKISKQIGWEK
jgi:hypothetical protein